MKKPIRPHDTQLDTTHHAERTQILREGMTFADHIELARLRVELARGMATGAGRYEEAESKYRAFQKQLGEKYRQAVEELRSEPPTPPPIHMRSSIQRKAMTKVPPWKNRDASEFFKEAVGIGLRGDPIKNFGPNATGLVGSASGQTSHEEDRCLDVPFQGMEFSGFQGDSNDTVHDGYLGLDQEAGGFATFKNHNHGDVSGYMQLRWSINAPQDGSYKLTVNGDRCYVAGDATVTGDFWHGGVNADSSVWLNLEVLIAVENHLIRFESEEITRSGTPDANKHHMFGETIYVPQEAYLDANEGDEIQYILRLSAKSWSSDYGIVNVNISRFGLVAVEEDGNVTLCN